MSRIENTDAAVLEVTVQTDHPTYNPGDTVPIRVHVTTSGGTVPVDDAEVFVSIIPPGGGAVGGLADLFGAPGWYTYEHALSPSAGGGVYTVKAQATRAGDTPGSAETTFTVTGAPAKKSVDWAVYNPSVTPANPTTEDPVRINVWLRIVATISPGPYPVDIICTVDGVLVGGGTITMSGSPPQMMVYTDPRRFPAGTHIATWVVDPDSEYNDNQPSNNMVSFQFTVTTPAPAFDFSLAASPPSQTIRAGETTSYTITATLTSGSPESVTLSVEGLPSGVSHTLSTTSAIPTFTSTLTIQTSESTTPGTYTITIRGESEGITKTTIVVVTVEAPLEKDFTILVTPTSQVIYPSQSTTYSITVTPVNQFDSIVTLTVSEPPSEVSANLNPATGTPPFTSTLIIDTVDSAQIGSFVLTITASGAGKTHAATVILVLEASTVVTTTQTQPFGLGDYTLPIIIGLIAVIVALAAIAMRRRGAAPSPRISGDIFCLECGARIPGTAKHCPKCGAEQKTA